MEKMFKDEIKDELKMFEVTLEERIIDKRN